MNDSSKSVSESRKWWEVANSQEEFSLFNELARNPDFTWRSTSGLATALGWSEEKLSNVMKKFVVQNIILTKTSKDGGAQKVAYWERVKEGKKDEGESEKSDLPF